MSTDAEKLAAHARTTAAFKRSETLFRLLIENSTDAIMLNDAEGNITYASPSIERILGYTPEEFCTLHASELIHPDDQQPTADLFMTLVRGELAIVTTTYRVRHKNGAWRWVEGIWQNLLSDPNLQSVVINVHDVTERKQIDERQGILDAVSEMFVSSLDHQITLKEITTLIVPKLADYCRIAVIDEQQQIKEITENHFDSASIALVSQLYEQYRNRISTTHGLQKLLETGEPELISVVSQEVLDRVSDNPELLGIVHTLGLQSYMGVPLIARGRTLGAITFSSIQPLRHFTHDDLQFALELARRIAFVLDNARLYREAQEEIAERKQVEERLRLSEERYRLVIEHTTDLITLMDTAGTVIYVSPSCETLLGYTQDEMIGEEAFRFDHPDDLPGVMAEFAHIFQGGIARVPSYRVRHKDGHWITLSGTGSAVYDEQGQPSLIISTSHDITQQQALEQRKDEFISMASHELKTPVTSMKGFTHILQKRLAKQEDEQSVYYLSRMDAQLDKLTRLINELLDISKMQTGQLEYREESFDLNALTREIIENVQGTAPHHHLVLEQQAPINVSADRDRIGQVLVNLLTNAIKFSRDADSVIVRVFTDGTNACVSVQDFGIGIDATEQQKIFERFYQSSDPVEKTYPGLGIGLHISNEIVNRHHGRMWVESSKGAGSTFFMSLPLPVPPTTSQM